MSCNSPIIEAAAILLTGFDDLKQHPAMHTRAQDALWCSFLDHWQANAFKLA